MVRFTKEDIIEIFAKAGISMCIVIMYWIFFSAYFSGYKTTIYINMFNEAHIEAFMLLLAMPCIIYYLRKHWFRNPYKNCA